MSEAMTFDVDPSNSRQLRDWDGEHGSYWAEYADLYDRSLAGYHPALLAAANAGPGDRILDVGCGSGQVAIDLVRAAPGARALGVDLSTAQLDVARRRGAGLAVEFAQADAQVHDFGAAAYDLIVSRTGTMFFGDAAAAFANLATATRPGGRLAILVWRGLAENQWLREIFEALRVGRDLPMPPPGAPGPFAQSDPAIGRAIAGRRGLVRRRLRASRPVDLAGPRRRSGNQVAAGPVRLAPARHRRGAARRSRREPPGAVRSARDARRRPTGLGGLADHRPSGTLSRCWTARRGAAPRPQRIPKPNYVPPTGSERIDAVQCARIAAMRVPERRHLAAELEQQRGPAPALGWIRTPRGLRRRRVAKEPFSRSSGLGAGRTWSGRGRWGHGP